MDGTTPPGANSENSKPSCENPTDQGLTGFKAQAMGKHGFNQPDWIHTDAAPHGEVATITLEKVINGEIKIQIGENGEIQHKTQHTYTFSSMMICKCSFTGRIMYCLVISFGLDLSFVNSLIIL